MSNLTTNDAQAQIVMREILDARIYLQYQNEAVTVGLFPDGEAEFVSSVGAQWANDVEPNPGIRGMSTSQLTFSAGSTSIRVRQKVTFAQVAITRAFDGNILWTDVKSLIKGYAPMIKEDMSSFIKHINILFHGDGSGTLGTVAAYDPAVTGTAVLVLTQPYGATQLLRRARINITTNDGNYTAHSFTVGSTVVTRPYIVVKSGSDTISLSQNEGSTVADTVASQTIVAGDVIQTDSSGGIMPRGLGFHFNNTSRTYQNVSTSTYPQFIPPLVDCGFGPLTVQKLDQLEVDLIFRQGTEQTLDGMFWLGSPTQILGGYRKLGYNTDMTVVKRFDSKDKELDLGYQTVKHNGRMFVMDVDADPTRLMLLNKPTWQKFVAKVPSIVNDGGNTLNAVYASTGELIWQYTMNINFMGELANKQIARNGALINLQWSGLPASRDVNVF
jgi:hypothetical protein